jgi:lipopolysaccharide/colanic/teichoic acid biosynthesis glycosyltransferase
VYPFFKRGFDLIVSGLSLLLLSPLLAAIALLIKLDSSGPVFYMGRRVGMNGNSFRMFKFRTMVINAEKVGGSSTPDDDPRITRMGHFLRHYKLDELPQLINVFLGEMSLVGPRPQVKWAVDLYSSEERQLLAVRPGITDYASLRYPNEGEILKGSSDPDREYMEKIHPEKMRLGLHYVRTRCFWADIKIIIKTIAALMK